MKSLILIIPLLLTGCGNFHVVRYTGLLQDYTPPKEATIITKDVYL